VKPSSWELPRVTADRCSQQSSYRPDAGQERSLPSLSYLKRGLERRFAECGLEQQPEKTNVVYRKDDNRAEDFPAAQFDFLGFMLRSRLAKNQEREVLHDPPLR